MTKDLLTTARERELGAYLVALESAGLRSELETKGPFTLFVPIDAAFERFSTSELDALDADFDALRRLMQYTVVRGALSSDSLARLDSVETLGGEPLEITVARGLAVNGIKIVEADVECSNGVAHIVAETPIPPSLRGLVHAEMLAPPTTIRPEDSPVSAQTVETIENAARNYAADAETARPVDLEKDYRTFAEELTRTEKDAETFAEDLRVAAKNAEALGRAVDHKEDEEDEEDEEDAGSFERGYERAEKAFFSENNDFYADVDSHFAENDARRDEEERVCVGGKEKTPSV
jgi:hypothetical protein